jgi:hypothetical protein
MNGLGSSWEHDLFGKPVSTFPDHALIRPALALGAVPLPKAEEKKSDDKYKAYLAEKFCYQH